MKTTNEKNKIDDKITVVPVKGSRKNPNVWFCLCASGAKVTITVYFGTWKMMVKFWKR